MKKVDATKIRLFSFELQSKNIKKQNHQSNSINFRTKCAAFITI